MHRNGTIFYKSVQLIACVDDIGRTMRDVIAAFSVIERVSAKIGLVVVDEWGPVSYGVSDHG